MNFKIIEDAIDDFFADNLNQNLYRIHYNRNSFGFYSELYDNFDSVYYDQWVEIINSFFKHHLEENGFGNKNEIYDFSVISTINGRQKIPCSDLCVIYMPKKESVSGIDGITVGGNAIEYESNRLVIIQGKTTIEDLNLSYSNKDIIAAFYNQPK